MSQKTNRWTRHMTIREAFARSVNTIFGKLGVFYVGHKSLMEYARRFGFNREIETDFPYRPAQSEIEPEDEWSVVEAASGFTRNNLMSPVHGAMIASTVANDGVLMKPYLVESVLTENGDSLYEASPESVSVAVKPLTAAELRRLMQATVRRGTSRRAFRKLLRNKRFDGLEAGGKTGSLTGLDPKGKCDWFVGSGVQGRDAVAFAVLTVNKKYWRVRSDVLARKFLTEYFSEKTKLSRMPTKGGM